MKRFIGLLLMIFVGMAGWRIGDGLSSDALSMAVGVLFGVLAGIPTALLVLSSSTRKANDREPSEQNRGYLGASYPSYTPQPPVIVLTGAAPHGYGPPAPSDLRTHPAAPAWPEPRSKRRFRVVGEKDEWVDEW